MSHTGQVAQALSKLRALLRSNLDPLGYIEYASGAFRTGHVPHSGQHAYLSTWYEGLTPDGITSAEEEAGRYIPEPYKELLSITNGMRCLGASLFGSIGRFVDRSGEGTGQPISLRYQNIYRPTYIPAGHLGIGTINGEWASQGHLYLASTGRVELYNALRDEVGHKWDTLVDFLSDEIPRRLSLFDERGVPIQGAKFLPGETSDWERFAVEAKALRKNGRSWLGRVMKIVWRN